MLDTPVLVEGLWTRGPRQGPRCGPNCGLVSCESVSFQKRTSPTHILGLVLTAEVMRLLELCTFCVLRFQCRILVVWGAGSGVHALLSVCSGWLAAVQLLYLIHLGLCWGVEACPSKWPTPSEGSPCDGICCLRAVKRRHLTSGNLCHHFYQCC